MEPLRFDGKVAVVTGAGGGLGASHARLLGSLGCAVVVNDIGGSPAGSGHNTATAEAVAGEIGAAGGQAVANADSVAAGEHIVQCAMDAFGRIDIVVNNAGNLKDRSFHKMSDEEWEQVYQVHLFGGYKVTRAAWPWMREQGSGRVVFTTSVAGLCGNFGQANYAAMKMAVVGLCKTLAIEGANKGIFVNAVSPSAASRMSDSMGGPALTGLMDPELVSGLFAYLCHDSCAANGRVFAAGGGWVGELRLAMSKGAQLGADAAQIGAIADAWADISDFSAATMPHQVTDIIKPMVERFPSLAAHFGTNP